MHFKLSIGLENVLLIPLSLARSLRIDRVFRTSGAWIPEQHFLSRFIATRDFFDRPSNSYHDYSEDA